MTAHDIDLAAARELFDITPLQPSLGAEIAGIDLSKPLDPAARDALRGHAARRTRCCSSVIRI